MVKILKAIAVILIIAILGAMCVSIILEENKYININLVKVSNIHLPDKVDKDNLFGFFFYNEDGTYSNSYYTDISKLNYDKNKPMIIFIHGVQIEVGYKGNETVVNAKDWLDAGYNVVEFLWSQFADGDPFSTQDRVWGINESMGFCYEGENSKSVYESKDIPNYGMAEIFVAYYADFMKKADFCGSEIHLTGLSMGANACIAVSNYLLTLEKAGKIPASYLPDRVTLFDAYLDNISENGFMVNWLNQPIGKNGTVGRAVETVEMLRDRGIAVSYIASSPVGFVNDLGDGEKGLFEKMTAMTAYMEFSAAFAGFDLAAQHIAGKNWYYRMIDQNVIYDSKDISAQEYAISPFIPISYTYARMGSIYTMSSNFTETIFSDDKVTSDVANPKIAGFAFFDANINGINDDRISNRIGNVKVALYDNKHNLIDTQNTSYGGYYQFNLKNEDIGKSFYIAVDLTNTSYAPSKIDTGSYECMGNGIKEDGKSEVFNINSVITLNIINIGLIKKA